MKILITGGHITPALAVIDELQKKYPEIEIVVAGRKYQPNSKDLSFEYQEVTKRNISFIHLEAGRLSRTLTVNTIKNLLKVPMGNMTAIAIVKKEKPDIILSFGGYIALAIALAGKVFNIPIYTHEQTLHPGLTNKIISHFAKKVFVSFPETVPDLKKAIFTGTPLRHDIFKIQQDMNIKKNKPIIYVTGGSLGSHAINLHIEQLLPDLLKKYIVIHQIGDVKEFDDYGRLIKIKNENYFPRKHILGSEIGYIFSKVDLVISRSGAGIISELIALKKIAILVPLPWSANGEQQAHAEFLQKKGVAEIFHQSEKSEKLLSLIEKMIDNDRQYQKSFDQLETYYQPDAAEKIIHEIITN